MSTSRFLVIKFIFIFYDLSITRLVVLGAAVCKLHLNLYLRVEGEERGGGWGTGLRLDRDQ